LLLGFSSIALPSLTVGLLTPDIFAHGTARDRGKRNQQVERIATADPRVIVSACTLSGSFTVRGWDRREVRVRSDGGDIELTRIDQSKSEQATELKVTSKTRRSPARNSCLMFGGIEMDVPRGASIKLQTTSGDISVTDVARAHVVTTSGSINLTKMRAETNATVIGGDITVRESTGLFNLHATGGSIDARHLAPLAASDTVSASTVSGEVTLNDVRHQRVNVNAVSGDVTYSGELPRNASYSFQNLSGAVHLLLPANSSFRLLASVGESAKISSDFDLKNTANQTTIPPSNRYESRRVIATVGTGEATIHLSLLSGSLHIRKQQK
jgi:DUF4097 and DUF4098 domain-containing protein YvlB